MEWKFYEKYTSLKVPLARFFLAPFFFPRPRRIDAEIHLFSRLDLLPHPRSGSCWTRGWSGSGRRSSRSFTMVNPGL